MNSTLSEGVLLRGQREWIADQSPLKVGEKGRRVGITWAEAADNVLIAATDRAENGDNVYYFPQSKEDSIEYIEACARWAKAFSKVASDVDENTWEQELGLILPGNDPDKHIKTFRIDFPESGNRIVALSSSPARARGKQGVFVIDEAAFHPNLRGVLKAVIAALLRGGRVRVISTHNGENNEFNALISEIRSGRRKGTVHRYTFMDAVRDGMYRRICELKGEIWTPEKEKAYVADVYGFYGDDAREELDAIPSAGTGTFLSSVLIEHCMVSAPILRLAYDDAFAHKSDEARHAECQAWLEEHVLPLLERLDPTLEHHYGMDFGRTGHLSVIAPMCVSKTLARKVPFLLEMRNVPFKQQWQVLCYVADRLPNFRSGANDGRGNGQAIAEFAWQKYGAGKIDAVMLSTEWYRDNMPPFKAAFEDSDIEIPKDADVLKDLRAIRMDNGVAKVPDSAEATGTDGKPRHGDSAIALALAYYATRMDVAPIEFLSAGRRETAQLDGARRHTDVGFGTVAGGNDFREF